VDVRVVRTARFRSDDGERVTIRRSLMTLAPDDPCWAASPSAATSVCSRSSSRPRRLRINGRVERISPTRSSFASASCQLSEASSGVSRARRLRAGRRDQVRPGTIDDERRRSSSARTRRSSAACIRLEAWTPHIVAASRASSTCWMPELRVPDYAGNSMFLTLGNFEVDPRASLAVVDFDRARLVSFSGRARLRFTGELPGHPTGGTGRYWELSVREWVEFDLPLAMRWDLLDSSPFNPSCPLRS
jgi:hypothetical protein